jgi:ATP-binding cassette subfamily B protein/subfamily B ATP-binding cassette protein MsbA
MLFANLTAALLEGASFFFILLGLSSLGSQELMNLNVYPIFSWFHLNHYLSSFTNSQLFFFFILSAVGLQAVRSTLSYVAAYVASLLALRIQTDVQCRVHEQIFNLSYPSISQYKIGDLAEYAKTPSTAIPAIFDVFNRLLTSTLLILGVSIFMFLISPSLTLVTVFLFGFFAVIQKFFIRKVMKASKQLSGNLVELSHETIQSLQGIRPIHIFSRHEYIQKKIFLVLDKISSVSRGMFLWNNFIPTISETINILLIGAVLLVGSFLLTPSQGLLLPSLLTYLALTYRLATRLQNAMGYLGSFAIQMGPMKRLEELLKTEGKEFTDTSGKRFEGLKEFIEFKNVSLLYPRTTVYALKDLSFRIQKGSICAFIGYSGAGKSSILDLLLRLFHPTEGKILIDSEELEGYSLESWRNYLGVVSQDSYLFNDSIEQNIRFGDLLASDEQVITAAKAAGAHEFISFLPQAYQTIVGERGYRLSGGEKQRISLARVLLRNPKILILDEATSSLDSHSESFIQESLDQFHQNNTILVVAHRLSTIVKADQIFVVENGRIIEVGSHNFLIEKGGRYAYLWNLQSSAP